MRRAERLEAIQRIARALSGRSYADVDLALSTFDLPTSDMGDWQDQYGYVIEMLRFARDSDESIAELDDYLINGAGVMVSADEEQIWRAGAFRLFISHTSAHRIRAAKLASAFNRLGVHAFVAHEDIAPTREWQDVIEAALLSCDALCAMLTDDFSSSLWCDQEVGFMVAQRKLVLPLKMGADPHGFIGKYQAIPSAVDQSTTYQDVQSMLEALVRHPTTAEKAAPVGVRRFARSNSFEAARDGFKLLQMIPAQEWSSAMIDEAEAAIEENPQIREAGLDSNRTVPEAVRELTNEIRPVSAPALDGNDDLPF